MGNPIPRARVLVCLLASVALDCGGGSPTTPAVPQLTPTDEASDAATLAEGGEAFDTAVARLGGLAGAASAAGVGPDAYALSGQDGWYLDLIRAPKSGQKFTVDRDGMFPKPPPQFRFRATAPVDIPQGALLALFVTAAGKECGLAVPSKLVPFTANVPRNMDIPNRNIIVGPDACLLEGQKCKPSQCKFPLTTTKMRVLFGNVAQGVAQGFITVKYKWTQ